MIERLRRASLLSLVLLALGASGCTVDDESVENKPCTPVGADPNKDCVKGYACLCQQGECTCRKIQTLLAPPTSMNVAPRSRGSQALPEDPNVRFLRRLGLFRD
jgi:hypothetical protein